MWFIIVMAANVKLRYATNSTLNIPYYGKKISTNIVLKTGGIPPRVKSLNIIMYVSYVKNNLNYYRLNMRNTSKLFTKY